MKKAKLIGIFLRSLAIHGSFNFRRMQNIGFVFAMIPLVRLLGKDKEQTIDVLTRHTQMFNTHPYMSGPLIGSIVKIEEVGESDSAAKESEAVKNALVGPYAAIGDPFFWGTLRPLCSVVAVAFALAGFLFTPLIFLLLYTPFHIWVRLKGFFEGYRRGRNGIEFIRSLGLPNLGAWLRWITLCLIAYLTALAATYVEYPFGNADGGTAALFVKLVMPIAALGCYAAIKKGVATIVVLYGVFLIFLLMSLTAS